MVEDHFAQAPRRSRCVRKGILIRFSSNELVRHPFRSGGFRVELSRLGSGAPLGCRPSSRMPRSPKQRRDLSSALLWKTNPFHPQSTSAKTVFGQERTSLSHRLDRALPASGPFFPTSFFGEHFAHRSEQVHALGVALPEPLGAASAALERRMQRRPGYRLSPVLVSSTKFLSSSSSNCWSPRGW